MERLLPIWKHQKTKWPYRPIPQPDELLSSYLMRLAIGLELKPITFLNTIWGSAQSLLNQDLDNFAPEHVVKRICLGTGRHKTQIYGMTLAEYEGSLLIRHNSCGRNPWILPTTIKSNQRRRLGLQYCPLCLQSDTQPYFRRSWRLAFSTMCTAHGVMLRDQCPNCAHAIHQHLAPSTRHCYHCSADLCTLAVPTPQHDYLSWQARLEIALTQGWMQLGDEFVRAHIGFAIIRQIATLLVNGKHADDFRIITARVLGGDPTPYEKPTKRQPIEYLTLEERHRLFGMVQRLMHGWPITFVSMCKETGIKRSQAIRDMTDPPFAYERVMRDYLDATPYYATEAEVLAAATWLRRTKGRATYADLSAICGESRAAIYKHMDYQRQPAVPSQWRTKAMC